MTTKPPGLELPLIYLPSTRNWIPIDPNSTPSPLGRGKPLEIFSWNLNCGLRHSDERVRNAISRIQRVYLRDYEPGNMAYMAPQVKLSLVVLLQGISASAMRILKAEPFIRDNFVLSDASVESLEAGVLGNVTLVSQDLCVGGCFRVPFRHSRTFKDAVFVDIVIESSSRTTKVQVLRVANTQLEESANHGGLLRPIQLANIMDFLAPPRPELSVPFPDEDVLVVGGIVGGDLHADEAADAQLPHVLGFRDLWHQTNGTAYTLPAGQNYDLENCGKYFGHTWGYQPFQTTAIPRRLDKILAVGDVVVEGKVTRVGVGNKITIRRFHLGDEFVFVSDHFGLKCEVRVQRY